MKGTTRSATFCAARASKKRTRPRSRSRSKLAKAPRRTAIALLIAAHILTSSSLHAWGGLGHRLVGLIAANRLTPVARQNVAWLLDGQSLADVSSWADAQVGAEVQTSFWHYLDIPPGAAGYDRDRDCPRQPGVAA